jgi:hypothetical protein
MSTTIITSFFNPNNNPKRAKNWHTWRNALSDVEIPIISIELSFNSKFETYSEIKLAGTANNLLFQKEALLNIALNSLDDSIDKVIWLDCDITFDNKDWLKKTESSLEKYPLVQLFDEVTIDGFFLDTNSGKNISKKFNGHIFNYENNILSTGSVGYAWAAQRSVLKHGFYDRQIAGTGDSAIAIAGLGKFKSEWIKDLSDPLRKDLLKWGAKFFMETKGEVGYVQNKITHLNHGPRAKYEQRNNVLLEENFDPNKHIKKDNQGLLSWTDEASEKLRDALK